MNILSKIEIENFKCFRKKTVISFGQATYLIGVNNSGKSSILDAIRFFFDESLYVDEIFLNKTTFLSKTKGSNKSTITFEFNLKALTTKKFKKDLITEYGNSLRITKSVSITEITKKITTEYLIENTKCGNDLPDNIKKLLGEIKLTYLHPQEGRELLERAQVKLRDRLLANWGRGRHHQDITQNLKKLEEDWEKLRISANKYLSTSLTQSLQEMYPEGEAAINLPKKVVDVIAVSDIDFRGYKGAPEVQLTSQGAGVQSAILYLTHFLLDSDRSLHRGEYHPIWLIEEPESFLHANLIIKLAQQLNSRLWLDNIQMIISTHSPLILATSRIGGQKVMWNLLDKYEPKIKKPVTKWTEHEISEIGISMGDQNFISYFLAAKDKKMIFIEDEKDVTVKSYINAGISITKGLRGTSDISKFVSVYKDNPEVINEGAYFIIDADKGKKDLSRYLTVLDEEDEGFKRYKVSEKLYIVLLPEGSTIEDLFEEFDNHLEECVHELFDVGTWQTKSNIPRDLVRCVADRVRGKQQPASIDDAKLMIKNTQDVKDLFWKKVTTEHLKINKERVKSLKKLLGIRK